MNQEDMKRVEEAEKRIGYAFRNKYLLLQALTRKAYSNEHPDRPHNEVMEHFGDSTVGWVVKLGLRKKYTYIDDDRGYLISRLNEGELTDKAQKYVSNENLARHTVRMNLMELAYFGKGEIKQDCAEQEKAQADLFEAIAYAVELDCDRHAETVMRVVLAMMGFSHWDQM